MVPNLAMTWWLSRISMTPPRAVHIEFEERRAKFDPFAETRERVLRRMAHRPAVTDDVGLPSRRPKLDDHAIAEYAHRPASMATRRISAPRFVVWIHDPWQPGV